MDAADASGLRVPVSSEQPTAKDKVFSARRGANKPFADRKTLAALRAAAVAGREEGEGDEGTLMIFRRDLVIGDKAHSRGQVRVRRGEYTLGCKDTTDSSVTLTVIWVPILPQIWLASLLFLRWGMKHLLGIWHLL